MDRSVSFGFLFVCLYVLPSVIASVLKRRHYRNAVVINIFLGWMLIGWIVALAMAVRSCQVLNPKSQISKNVGMPNLPLHHIQTLCESHPLLGTCLSARALLRKESNFRKKRLQISPRIRATNVNRRWWILVGFGLLSSCSAVSNGNSLEPERSNLGLSVQSTTTTPSKRWTEILNQGVVGAELSSVLCDELSQFINSQLRVINDRLDDSENPNWSAFDSADYLKTIDWETFKHEDDVLKRQLEITASVLSENTAIQPSDDQEQAFLDDTISTCEVTEIAQQLSTEAIRLDTRLRSMQNKAENLPWYPRDFEIYTTEIAFRWLNRGEFSCSIGDHCWGMLVVAKNGCPSSLYAEITILDSGGSNIGFTNDTTSGLSPGQQAKLIFEDFTPDANSARLSKISCY
jgi:hypothetical protein